ncbi:MAG: VWA domain-containing protein [Desulfobacterales bacterium]|nr:VWA domain-containing protein [Desulfobacterales bacterium]
MISLVQKFVEVMRVSGLRVSTSEVIDCSKHLEMIDTTDRDVFKTVLRANFIKTRRDHSKFDHLFSLFFDELDQNPELEGFDSFDSEFNDLLDMMKKDGAVDSDIIDFLEGNPKGYLEQIQAVQELNDYRQVALKSNMGQLTGRLQLMLKLNKAKERFMGLLGTNYNTTSEPGKSINKHFKKMMETAEVLISKDPRPNNESLKKITKHKVHYKGVGEIPFASLSNEDIEEIRAVIDKLVKKLKDIVSRRYYVKNKGVLDIKKTIRKSAKYHSIPIEIKYRDRPLRKGKIVVLCDISGSVWSTSRFMLNLLYALSDCFSKVRSFVFVSEIAEVTSFFNDYGIDIAISKILEDAGINYESLTDYGETFSIFKKEYIGALDKKTTLIMIGDGRSNYQNPQDTIFNEMRERCRRVIWLNPESESSWNTGDSEMYTYKNFCHEVRTCGNLNQLIDFVEELVL